MQETTFNKAFQADGPRHFSDTTAWLSALYTEASLKKFDQNELYHIISNEISFEQLEQKIKYTFKDKKNLAKSLMQSTFCYEMKETTLQSNERLEFLGDSLINFIVGKNLFHKYLNNDEGDLSKLRGALVNEEKLAELARIIDLGNFIFLGKGEMRTGGADKDSILADTFEALFAGIYFDSENHIDTLETVFNTIVRLFEEKNKTEFYSLNQLEVFDTKSKLQELTMGAHGTFPTYRGTELPNNGGYRVEVWLGQKILAEMTGPSKKKIEKLLAKKIIDEKLY
ncbi:MAG: ribonuclease III [Bacteriovorax sp.]|nr:ribonuclease III [Bacteriovorax sp.]